MSTSPQFSADPARPVKSVEQIFAEFRAGIPNQEFQKLPKDGSTQLDQDESVMPAEAGIQEKPTL